MKSTIDKSKLLSFPEGIASLPNGWLNSFDAAVLYTAARMLPNDGSILEVGSWIGRSSCVIASAVRDSAPMRLRYDIVDYGIAGADEWRDRFNQNLFAHKEAKKLSEVIMFPGGTGALLKQNLVSRDLSKFVRLIVLGDISDFTINQRYDFVFCDATHGPEEIKKNVPILRKFFKDNDFLFVCDDILTDDDAKLAMEISGASQYYLTRDGDQYSKMAIFTSGKFVGAFG